MRKYLLAFFFFFALNTIKAQTPKEQNDQLVGFSDSLYMYGQQWGQKINQLFKTKDFKQLEVDRIVLEKFVNDKFKWITKVKDISGSEALRRAVLSYLQLEKDLIQTGLMPFERLTVNSSNEVVQAAIDNLKTLTALEEKELAKVREEQKAYASKNGFLIQGQK
jgi:hypothetical protein